MLSLKNSEYQQISKQLLSEFEIAVHSECSIDEHYRRAFSLNNDNFAGIPRPAKWVGFAKKSPAMLFIIFQLCKLAWILGGGAVYYFFQMTCYFCRSLFMPYRVLENQVGDEFALGFSRRAMDVIADCSIGRQPDCWILLPWVRKKSHDESQHVVDVLSMVRFADFIMAFSLSIRALYTVGLARAGRGVGGRVLSTYIAFQWFLARIALNKLNAKFFIIAEHHDRWAVLADCLVQSKLSYGASLVIVQHGVESSLKASHRLRNVSRLYVYNEESLRIFEKNIIDMSVVKNRLDVCFYMPRISLKTLDCSKFPHEVSVLMVGHPSVEPLHVNIYETLLKGRDFNVIYKPHPTVRESKELRKIGWVIWENKDEFPIVNILVSYPSTLVEEYHAAGIEAVVHPYAISVDNAANYLSNLSAVLEVFLTKAGGNIKND
ncbi:MAG: hypothetical protein Q7J46_06875 [Pseudomonas sp.]|nr:hypothetical protein [Pseudomonas sp.]